MGSSFTAGPLHPAETQRRRLALNTKAGWAKAGTAGRCQHVSLCPSLFKHASWDPPPWWMTIKSPNPTLSPAGPRLCGALCHLTFTPLSFIHYVSYNTWQADNITMKQLHQLLGVILSPYGWAAVIMYCFTCCWRILLKGREISTTLLKCLQSIWLQDTV